MSKELVFENTNQGNKVFTTSHCAKMEMNEEKPSKFQFHFPVLLVP